MDQPYLTSQACRAKSIGNLLTRSLKTHTWVPEPPKLSLNLMGCPVASSYSRANCSVMRWYALRETAKEHSVSVTLGSLGFCFSSLPLACSKGSVREVFEGIAWRLLKGQEGCRLTTSSGTS